MSAIREGLLRSVPFQLAREEAAGDGLTLDGYAAMWESPTEINSWEGRFVEKIRKGAFRKSIRENTPVLQFDHGQHPLIGSIPIGRIESLQEDDQGLHVEARLSDNWLIQPVRDAIAEKTIKGMSFRFDVIREEWRDNAGKLVRPEDLARLLWDAGDRGPLERTLIELRTRELGPVVFPAYTDTSVGVRARGVATLIGRNLELAHEIRASLAREIIPGPRPGIEDLGDPDVRREVARALLFGDDETLDAPPDTGHPSTSEPREVAGLSAERDAPPDGHPSPTTDAPLPGEHPSTDPTRADRLRGYIREVVDLMEDRLATINTKEK